MNIANVDVLIDSNEKASRVLTAHIKFSRSEGMSEEILQIYTEVRDQFIEEINELYKLKELMIKYRFRLESLD